MAGRSAQPTIDGLTDQPAKSYRRCKVVWEAAFEHAIAEQFVVIRPLGQVEDHVIFSVPAIEESSNLSNWITIQTLHTSAWVCHRDDPGSDVA